MSIRTRIAVALAVGLGLGMGSRALPAADGPEKIAEATAAQWLAVADAGQYGESWDAAAELFKKAVTRDQWIQALSQVRSPFGKLVSRKLRLARYLTDMPGAPTGEYVVMEFDTTFANSGAMTERITPMNDPDGTWRVSGYFLLPTK
jgi:hypothetical protein